MDGATSKRSAERKQHIPCRDYLPLGARAARPHCGRTALTVCERIVNRCGRDVSAPSINRPAFIGFTLRHNPRSIVINSPPEEMVQHHSSHYSPEGIAQTRLLKQSIKLSRFGWRLS